MNNDEFLVATSQASSKSRTSDDGGSIGPLATAPQFLDTRGNIANVVQTNAWMSYAQRDDRDLLDFCEEPKPGVSVGQLQTSRNSPAAAFATFPVEPWPRDLYYVVSLSGNSS
jgi:hypothetical protein